VTSLKVAATDVLVTISEKRNLMLTTKREKALRTQRKIDKLLKRRGLGDCRAISVIKLLTG